MERKESVWGDGRGVLDMATMGAALLNWLALPVGLELLRDGVMIVQHEIGI